MDHQEPRRARTLPRSGRSWSVKSSWRPGKASLISVVKPCAAGPPCPAGLTVPDVALPELRFSLPTLALLPATLHFEPLEVDFTTQQPLPGADCQAKSSLSTLAISLEVVLGGAFLELPVAWSTTVATVTLYGIPPSRLVWYSPGFLVTSPWEPGRVLDTGPLWDWVGLDALGLSAPGTPFEEMLRVGEVYFHQHLIQELVGRALAVDSR
jgi:hypothetical protein